MEIDDNNSAQEKPEHPALSRIRRMDSSGRAAAYSIDEQWQRVIMWHEFLEDEASDNYPMIAGLNEEFASIGNDVVDRGKSLQSVAGNPLETFFYFIEMGMYPPPELMFVLLDCWDVYKANSGRMTIEESFIGPTKKGAGNYAKRSHAGFRKMYMSWDFMGFLKQGCTRAQAAEALSIAMNGKPDADSILRMMRGFGGTLKKKKAEK